MCLFCPWEQRSKLPIELQEFSAIFWALIPTREKPESDDLMFKSDAKKKIDVLQKTVEMQRQDIHNLLLRLEQMVGEIESTRARIPKAIRPAKNP